MEGRFLVLFLVIIIMTNLHQGLSKKNDDPPDCSKLYKEYYDFTEDLTETKKISKRTWQLTVEEERAQPKFYGGKLVSDIINLCKDNDDQYDFYDSNCIANKIVLEDHNVENITIRKEVLQRRRRYSLCEAILKVYNFRKRLEDPREFIVQITLFICCTIIGIYLIAVGHFRVRTIFDPRYPDPTKGWPYWIYRKMKFYVVPVGQEIVQDEAEDEMLAYRMAEARDIQLDDVIDIDDEKEDVLQTAAAVTDYSDFWHLFTDKSKAEKTQPGEGELSSSKPEKGIKNRKKK